MRSTGKVAHFSTISIVMGSFMSKKTLECPTSPAAAEAAPTTFSWLEMWCGSYSDQPCLDIAQILIS